MFVFQELGVQMFVMTDKVAVECSQKLVVLSSAMWNMEFGNNVCVLFPLGYLDCLQDERKMFSLYLFGYNIPLFFTHYIVKYIQDLQGEISLFHRQVME